jgi:GntP family gluconate:H+ symporter
MQPDYWLLIVLLLSIAMIVAGTSRFKIHPFLVLIAASYFAGLCAGMPVGKISEVISSGFGSLMAGIGLVIVFGTLIGTVLEKSGAAIKLAEWVIRIIGPRYPALAMSIIGYIVSIPVFCDSAFIILSTLKKNLALKTGKSPMVLSIALATGLYATHTFVPPTPGPIAAAGNLGLNDHLGTVIGFGLLVALSAMIAGYIWALRQSGHMQEAGHKNDDSGPAHSGKLPATYKAILPILMPIILIALRSFAGMPFKPLGEGYLYSTLDFAGSPLNALVIGFLFSLQLFPKFDKETLSGWVGESIVLAAPILLITGAGGSFGAILKETRIGDILGEALSQYELGIFLPFIVAAIFKSAQGSSTVSLVATSALIAPLLPSLGLDSVTGATLAVMATGAGAMTVSHANDSYFWVVTQFSGMDVTTGYKSHTMATLIQGITAMVTVWILSLIFI